MLSKGLCCLGLYVYCESEQVRRLATRKLDTLLGRMRAHYQEQKKAGGQQNEEDDQGSTQIRFLENDDEQQTGGSINFQDFLIVSQYKGSERPDVFKAVNGSINWQEKLSLKNQTILDTVVICDVLVDLSTVVIDLTRNQIAAQPKTFSELI